MGAMAGPPARPDGRRADRRPRSAPGRWYPEGWAPDHGNTRDLALELLYVITLHDWPDLAPDPARLAALIAAGYPCPSTPHSPSSTGTPAC